MATNPVIQISLTRAFLAVIIAGGMKIREQRRIQRRRNRGRCKNKKCRNRKRKDRDTCNTCDSREKRKRNPMRYAYRNLRSSAAKRDLPFTISFEYFEKFALASDYLNKTGIYGHCLTVDRKDNLKGYVPGNIKPMTRAENARKMMLRDEMRYRNGMRWQEA